METAEIIAADRGLPVQVRDDLGEVRFGRWTNRTFRTLTRTKLWSTVQRWPSGARFPDGESLLETQARALAELDRLHRAHPRHAIACVSHSDVIRLVVAHFLGVHIDLFQRIAIAPASITVVAVGDGGPQVLAVNTSSLGVPIKP
jgi:probable phosphoglycerate mutase